MRYTIRLALCIAVGAHAATFELIDRNGGTNGPFRVVSGEIVQADGNTYTLRKGWGGRSARSADLLSKAVIDEVDFRETPVGEAIRQIDEAVQAAGGPVAAIRLVHTGTKHDREDEPRITFSAKSIRAVEAIDIIAELARYDTKWLQSTVLLGEDPIPGPMRTVAYDMIRPVAQTIGLELASSRSEMEEHLKGFFGQFGVKWPAGSHAAYVEDMGKFFILNTEDNLQAFENTLACLQLTHPMVEVEATYVGVDRGIAQKMIMDGGMTVCGVQSAWRTGQGRIIASLRVVTPDREEARVKSVVECRCPAGHRGMVPEGNSELVPRPPEHPVLPSTNHQAAAAGVVVDPVHLGSREHGTIAAMRPEIRENSRISVAIAAELIPEPNGYMHQEAGQAKEADPDATSAAEPLFPVITTQTRVLIGSGDTVLVSSHSCDQVSDEYVVLLLRASLVIRPGKELRRDSDIWPW